MRAQHGTRDYRGELACVMPLTRFPHIETHLHIVPHGKLVVLPGAAGLPGCCRGAAGVLPGVAGLPGTWTQVLTAGLGSQAAGLPGCRVLPGAAGCCRVYAGLPGCCRVGAGPGCRVAGARAQTTNMNRGARGAGGISFFPWKLLIVTLAPCHGKLRCTRR